MLRVRCQCGGWKLWRDRFLGRNEAEHGKGAAAVPICTRTRVGRKGDRVSMVRVIERVGDWGCWELSGLP